MKRGKIYARIKKAVGGCSERRVWEEVLLRTWKSQPFVSAVLVAINTFIFILCHFTGELLYDAGRLDIFGVLVNGEYGRIFWAMFLHSGIAHLFNNMMILFFMGSMIEKEVGHLPYAIVYFLSGIGGNIVSLSWKAASGDFAGSVGASGAIFGLNRVLLAMVLLSRRRMENVTPLRVALLIAYSLYSGFTGENIDNAAHVGGLATGFLAAAVMCIISGRKRGRYR